MSTIAVGRCSPGASDVGVLGVDVDDVDAQVRVAGVVVAGRRRIVAGGVVLHELHREAVELEHGDLDLGALVPGEGVEPLTPEAGTGRTAR